MKPYPLVIAGMAAAALLTACGQAGDETKAQAPAQEPAGSADPPASVGAAAAKTARGVGTVTAVDAAAGTITLNHAPIAEVGWPAMTMGFKASPQLASGVKVGDKVSFDLTLKDGAGEITAIQKQ